MNPIKITYRPISWLPIIFKANGVQPQIWTELTPPQIIALACAGNGTIDDAAFLAAMCDIRKFVIRKLDNYQRFQLSEALQFFKAGYMHNAFVQSYVKPGLKKYYTPKPKLKGMSFGQFIFADTYFGMYQAENKPEHLHKFIAALCIPNRKNFNEEEVEYRTKQITKLYTNEKEALVVNYMLIRAWLAKVYPLIFSEGVQEETNPPKSPFAKGDEGKKKYDSSGWIKIFEGLVGDNITDHDKYAKLPVHEVLRYLSRKMKENMKKKK